MPPYCGNLHPYITGKTAFREIARLKETGNSGLQCQRVATDIGDDAIDEIIQPFAADSRDQELVGLQKRQRVFCAKQIEFVIDREPVMITSADFLKDLENNRLFLETFGVGYVNNMEDQIGLNNLFESCAKRGYQLMRQLSNEPDRI